MRVKQLTTPALPITLVSVKDHLRIEQSETVYDAELTELIRTAQEWIFATCHICLTSASYLATFKEFPRDREPIKIPAYPVSEIQTLGYRDKEDGTTFIFGFQEDFVQVPNKIYPSPKTYWPDDVAEDVIDAVMLTFVAGYGETESSVPAMAKHLIKLLVGHWFKHREAVLTGTISKEIEIAADNLMKLLRVNEFEAFT